MELFMSMKVELFSKPPLTNLKSLLFFIVIHIFFRRPNMLLQILIEHLIYVLSLTIFIYFWRPRLYQNRSFHFDYFQMLFKTIFMSKQFLTNETLKIFNVSTNSFSNFFVGGFHFVQTCLDKYRIENLSCFHELLSSVVENDFCAKTFSDKCYIENLFWFSWTIFKCLCRFPFTANNFWQMLHWKSLMFP